MNEAAKAATETKEEEVERQREKIHMETAPHIDDCNIHIWTHTIGA